MLGKGSNDFLNGYQEGLLSIDQLRERVPLLHQHQKTLRAELQSIVDQTNDRAGFLRLADPHRIPYSLAQRRRQRLVSSNARESCDSWLKKFWSVKIPSLFVTASRFLRVRLKTAARSQKAQITFCVRCVISPLLSNLS